MKNKMRKKQFVIQTLKPEEMLLIRGGGEKPKDPKSPDEVILLI